MLHVNNRDGFTIAVSENRHLARIARAHGAQRQRVQRAGAGARADRRLGAGEIRALFESYGLTLQEWEKARTDRVTVARLPGVATGEVGEPAARGALDSTIWAGWRRRSSCLVLLRGRAVDAARPSGRRRAVDRLRRR